MIEIRNLDFNYKQTVVFRNLSLRFEKGNIYGLLGENGVGKTTLLKIISGLLRPSDGSCTLNGNTSYERLPEMLQSLFFMPDAVTLPDGATPERYIRELGVFYPTYNHDDFLHLMQAMEVEPDMKFQQMSFGMQKKSLIACALALNTDYLLLDEPTNGLDIPSKSNFRRILTERLGNDKTIIISTHQVRDVENLIDPIVIISQNNLLLDAYVTDITQKLFFEYGGPQRPEALFSEPQPGGYMNVLRNNDGEESKVNIEALFNAVLRNTAVIKEMFSGCSSSAKTSSSDDENIDNN
jgi:ABC-2 type transport system ATP-binding protein